MRQFLTLFLLCAFCSAQTNVAPMNVQGALTAKSVNTVVNPITNPATDIGAQIRAVLGSDVHVLIPSHSAGYTMSTPVANTYSGAMVECADPGTVINWTASSGSAFKTDGTQRVRFKGCTVNTTVAANTSVCLQVGGSGYTANTDVEDWHCGVEDSNAHFAKGIWVTGNDTTGPAGNTRISNSHIRNYTSVGLQIDHAVDTYVLNTDNYAVPLNPTHAWGTIVDTGASGFYFTNLSNGSAGMIIRNSMPTTNAFGKPPNFGIGLVNVINDSCYNSACLLLDASLSTPSGPGSAFYGYKYYFYGGWSAGCQLTNCSGVVVQGGIDIKFFGHATRFNQCHGYLLDYPDSTSYGPVDLIDLPINSDNVQAGSCDDLHVTAGTSNFYVLGGDYYGNHLGDNGATSRYGVYIEAGASDRYTIAHLNSRYHSSGPYSDNGTGTHKLLMDIRNESTADVVFPTKITWGDANNYLQLISSNPTWNVESNNSLYFDRTSHQWNFSFSGSKVAINSTQMVLASGVTLSTTNAPNFGGGISVNGNAFSDSSRNLTLTSAASVTTNAASAGFLRMAKTDTINIRNNANGADLPIGIDGSDNFTFNSSVVPLKSAASAGKAICWKTTTTLGYCSTVVASDGTCTCN